MTTTFKIEQNAGMTNTISDYLNTHDTRAVRRVKDLLLSNIDFSYAYAFAELKVAITAVREEMERAGSSSV